MSVEMLERSTTARFANYIWRLRDGHLSKLHPFVPKQTRESLRQAPLLGKPYVPRGDSGYCRPESQGRCSTSGPRNSSLPQSSRLVRKPRPSLLGLTSQPKAA